MAAVLEIPHTASFLLRDEDSTVTKIRLNPESFSILQEAIANGMKLPASAQDFEHRYERVIFQKFLARDPSVYDFILQVFVRTQGTCARFRHVADDDMPTIGQLLVRVADSAMDLLGVRLKVLVDNQTDDNIKDALEEIFQKLDCLNVAASGLAKMSESLSGHIAQFKVDSKANSENGYKLDDRWHKARISDEEWSSKVQESMEYMRLEWKRLQEQADELSQQARYAPPADSFAWKIFELAPESCRPKMASQPQEKIQESLRQVQDEMDRVRDQASKEQDYFQNATNSIESLHETIHSISRHAEDVVAAISDIHCKFLGLLSTC
ncbi:hypothetical protein BJ166DRAFT_512352 [Pestalotiopsis sp. NC0098]|nr:hypothetical protein BJ166DRAFT_512352 [Pestalotiopsis sp. NC0098]